MEKGFREISQQSKQLQDSLMLRKIEVISKTSKVVLSKECMSLKTRGLEKKTLLKKIVPDLFSVTN